ncbi:putative quinol monooxygenase [Formosa haliotis]|uniref:putative quinol monooxygenase n=1 Tax=Formosa haliotis TaxID=1555194 RepID=UPI0008248D8B|nr:antibiotic biosynthesis monooxygenase [Formosa haliotis]
MTSNQLTIVTRIVTKEEHLEFVKTELLKLIPFAKTEQGCIAYYLHQDISEPKIFMLYEKWGNPELWQLHMKSNYMVNFMKLTEGTLEEFEAREMISII